MLATQDVWPSSTAHLTNEERLQRFREKAHIIDLQIMSLAQDAAELAASDAWDEDGSASAIDWIRFNGHMTSNAAADLIAVGKNLQRMPESHQAVYQGEIGYAHVKAMARTAAAVGTKFEEAPLLEQARENSPGKFCYICHHYRHAADRKGFEAERAELVENRKLWISKCEDGTVLAQRELRPRGRGRDSDQAETNDAQVRCSRRPESGKAECRCSGRACLWRRVASPAPGHELDRDSAWAGWCTGGRDGVLASRFLDDRGAAGL